MPIKPIVLIGYRGSGKSTAAQWLADCLRCPWADSDVEIERLAGKSIAEIFAVDGVPRFRDLEETVLADLIQHGMSVVAAGGGVVLRERNRELLQSTATVVWLRASPKVLWERISADEVTNSRRPNLTDQGGLAEVEKLLAEREQFYQACANVIVETAGKSPQLIAEEIMHALPVLDLENYRA